MKIALFSLLSATLAGFMSCTPVQVVPDDCLQLLVGVADTARSTIVELHRFQRSDAYAQWERVGKPTSAVIGRRGLAVGRGIVDVETKGYPEKREGDGKSPAGVFRLSAPYGYGKGLTNASSDNPVTPITDSTACVDDPTSPQYGQIVDVPSRRGRRGVEPLRRADGLYSRLLVVGHNGALDGDVVAGKGSCIFIHVARGARVPTAGCTALPEEDIDVLIRWLRPRSRPVYVLAPRAVYDSLAKSPRSRLPVLD